MLQFMQRHMQVHIHQRIRVHMLVRTHQLILLERVVVHQREVAQSQIVQKQANLTVKAQGRKVVRAVRIILSFHGGGQAIIKKRMM